MTRFATLLLLLLAISTGSFAQFIVTKMDKIHLPKGLQYKGQLINAVRWTDKGGKHVVIETEIRELVSKKGAQVQSMRVSAQHFLIVGKDSLRQTWQFQDGEAGCPVEVTANFSKNTFQVTDLNKDGIAEVWLMYKTVCRGDVTPVTKKIIMYQGTQKFAMRGHTTVVSAKEWVGGKYLFDPAFQAGPKEFRDFALALWQKNIL